MKHVSRLNYIKGSFQEIELVAGNSASKADAAAIEKMALALKEVSAKINLSKNKKKSSRNEVHLVIKFYVS